MLRGRIDRQGTIVALEVSTACDISLPLLLMGLRSSPRHSFVAWNEFGLYSRPTGTIQSSIY